MFRQKKLKSTSGNFTKKYSLLEKELEIRKCKFSFLYFCENFLKVKNEKGEIVPFHLNQQQQECINYITINQHSDVKKDRGIGITTVLNAWLLWSCLFKTNFKSVSICTNSYYAENVLELLTELFEQLPAWMTDELSISRNGLFARSSLNEVSIFNPFMHHVILSAYNHIIFDEIIYDQTHFKTAWSRIFPSLSVETKIAVFSSIKPQSESNDLFLQYKKSVVDNIWLNIIVPESFELKKEKNEFQSLYKTEDK